MRKIILTLMVVSAFLFGANENAKDIYKIKTVSGKELTFTDTPDGMITSPYEGKIVFLEFWGTWCGPCLLSIPHHQALQEKYKDDLRIVAIETTPDVNATKLLEFKNNTSKAIDFSKVQWFLDNKAKSAGAKEYFKKPVNELKEFIKSGKNITYDLITSKDAGEFLYHIANRANWRGSIPFLIVFDKKGRVIDIVRGMPEENRLISDINKALQK